MTRRAFHRLLSDVHEDGSHVRVAQGLSPWHMAPLDQAIPVLLLAFVGRRLPNPKRLTSLRTRRVMTQIRQG